MIKIKYEIKYSKSALKFLQKIQPKIRKLIVDAINNIPEGDIKPMRGYKDSRDRLRVGKYRVVYRIDIDNNIEILNVIDIDSRGGIYK